MNPNNSMKVIKAGIHSLLQDTGRTGWHSMGITSGGPLDQGAFYWANLLCNNPKENAALEITLGGLVLESRIKTVFAVTGAEIPLTINNKPAELWQSHSINPGDRIELGYARSGVRAYLAVAGGFQVQPVFNSVATVTREGLGGLQGDGSPLKEGDLLPCKLQEGTDQNSLWQLPSSLRPDYSQKSITLRVVPGYQEAAFSTPQKQQFFSSEYLVTQDSNAMGYRLKGEPIKPSVETMLSEGITLGAIQFPPDGQPIVLLNDRQTIGGYPKIGSLLSLDIARLAQPTANATVRFEPLSIEQAQTLVADYQNQFRPDQRKPVQS